MSTSEMVREHDVNETQSGQGRGAGEGRSGETGKAASSGAVTGADRHARQEGGAGGRTAARRSNGLEGVVAASTRLSRVDGEAGELVIGGYALEEIAPRADFEEMAFLLWNDRLPTAAELASLRQRLDQGRRLPPAVLDLLRAAARGGAEPMAALRMAVAALDVERVGAAAASDLRAQAIRLVAAVPAAVAAYHRLSNGLESVEPPPGLGHAAAFLYQLEGAEPAPERVRALSTYLDTVIDHGFNASTFTARVIVSTGAGLVSAITGAVGALAGPLHGGAPGPALDTVFEIGTAERAEEVLRAKLVRGERLMGFGHRVYRVRDPRADVLAAAAEALFTGGPADAGGAVSTGSADRDLYALARHVEATALRLLREHKPDRRLDTNVEFYTALLLHGLELPVSLFTPVFAVGRVAGWTAHCLEQVETGRLIRPASDYHGEVDRRWLPLEARG